MLNWLGNNNKNDKTNINFLHFTFLYEKESIYQKNQENTKRWYKKYFLRSRTKIVDDFFIRWLENIKNCNFLFLSQ